MKNEEKKDDVSRLGAGRAGPLEYVGRVVGAVGAGVVGRGDVAGPVPGVVGEVGDAGAVGRATGGAVGDVGDVGDVRVADDVPGVVGAVGCVVGVGAAVEPGGVVPDPADCLLP